MKRTIPVVLLALVLGSTPLEAQKTGPQSNLVFGVAGVFTTGKNLWAVPDQPLRLSGIDADTLGLTRSVDGGLGLMFYGMYFPRKSFGITGEVFFMGTGYQDTCKHVFVTTDANAAAACRSIDGDSRSTSTVMLTVGGVLRAKSRGAISPYVRLGGGLAVINRSSVAVQGNTAGGVVEVYVDDNPRNVSPVLMFGGGFTAHSKRGGYQIRLEFRDNIVGYDKATAATAQAGIRPPTDVSYRHLWSFIVGFDIVLERSRGRRY